MPRLFTCASLLAVALFAVALTWRAPHTALPPAHGKPRFLHRDNTQWPCDSRILPTSWVNGVDVDEARCHVNFSNRDYYRSEEQEEFLTGIGTPARTRRIPALSARGHRLGPTLIC